MLLTMEGECIRGEIYTFFGRSPDAPSKAAFYRQLHKLKDGALRCLPFAFNRQLKYNLFNSKYCLVACDGSALDIFRAPDGLDTFYPPSKMSPKGYNQAYINAFYSILDRRFTGPAGDGPASIYFGDRGYASYNNFAHVIENGQYFLIRCTDKKAEKILGRSLEGVQALDTHKIEQKERKYEYQVNYSQAVKACRYFLRIHDGKSVMDVEGLVASCIEAVRPGRTFPRQKRFKIPMDFCYRN